MKKCGPIATGAAGALQPPAMSDAEQPQTQTDNADAVPVGALVQMLVAFSLMFTAIAGLHWYIGSHLIDGAAFAPAISTVVWVGLALVLGGFFGSRLLPARISAPAQWLGFAWLGTFALLLTGTAVSDLVLLGLRAFGPLSQETLTLRSLVVLGITLPALIWGAWVARRPEVKKVSIEVDSLGAEFDGYRIVQLSDVHISDTLGRGFAQWLTEQVNALAPDAIALTGDLIEGSVARIRDGVAPFGELKARDGTFFVTGNHEYYHGASSWQSEWKRLGARVLQNEHHVIERGSSRLVIGGVPDLQGGRFSDAHRPDVARAFAGAPEGTRVLLAHQPLFAKYARGHQVGLMLSGHTHGGQIFPFMAMVKLQQPVIAGLERIHEVLTYTSNGTGYWGPPFRIGPRGEITEITLRVKR